MEQQTDNRSQSSTDLISNLMKEEMSAIKFYAEEASRAGDPTLRSIFQKLVEIRLKCYNELETRMLELKSQSEITGQINAMFR